MCLGWGGLSEGRASKSDELASMIHEMKYLFLMWVGRFDMMKLGIICFDA